MTPEKNRPMKKLLITRQNGIKNSEANQLTNFWRLPYLHSDQGENFDTLGQLTSHLYKAGWC